MLDLILIMIVMQLKIEKVEKNIPKEQEERINLIKKFNRPDTSYGRQKKNN